MKNPKVVIYSILALLSLALTYLVHWLFALAVAILIYLSQKELMRPSKPNER